MVRNSFVERFAGFELRAVDQQGARPREPFAVIVVIAEQREAASLELAVALAHEARNEVVNQLRGRGVVADHDEHRRHVDACLLPQSKGLSVMAV